MGYLRQWPAAEGAKEDSSFSLERLHEQPFHSAVTRYLRGRRLPSAHKKLLDGGALASTPKLGYYGSYAFVIWLAVRASYNALERYTT